MSLVEIGCQGWNYEDWITPAGARAVFYPRGTRTGDMLEIYARAFSTVEVDSTFYAIPAAATVENWRKRTPDNFTFALKLPRAVTHERMLRRDSWEITAAFAARAVLLQEKLAAVLIQLPPQFTLTAENSAAFKSFMAQLPSDVRWAVEFRAAEWLHPRVLAFLRNYNIALALVAGQWLDAARLRELAGEPTANFSYWRWMGARDLTSFARVQRPQETDLRHWAAAMKETAAQVPHNFAYFSNFYEGHAPASANTLKELLGQTSVPPDALETQPTLF